MISRRIPRVLFIVSYGLYEGQVLSPTHSPSLPAPSRRVSNTSALIPPPTPRLEPIPLPPMSFDDTTLNALVIYAYHPRIQYDVRRHPDYASAPTGRQHWSEEPVTNPPCPKMVIVCMVLPRPFVIYPASRDLNYVTVRDLLAATHNAFREAAHEVGADDETRGPGFSIWSGASNRRYTWAGLSEQTARRTWEREHWVYVEGLLSHGPDIYSAVLDGVARGQQGSHQQWTSPWDDG